MDNNNDKKIIKAPHYSIEKLGSDISLVKRGLRDLNNGPKIEALYKQVVKKYLDGLFDECIQLCIEVLSIEPDHFGTLYFYGVSLYKKADYKKALTYLTRCIDVDDGSLVPLFSTTRASCYFETGNYQKAFDDYKNSLLIADKKSATFLNMSLCLLNLKEYKNSLFYLDKAIELHDSGDAYLIVYMAGKAEILEKLERIPEALEMCWKILEKFPDNKEAQAKIIELQNGLLGIK